jgi:hypothetical protein
MNVTKEVIADLLPLYVANECSPDSRAIIEEYLSDHPEFAREIKVIQKNLIPLTAPPSGMDETAPLKKARKILRWRSVLMGLAIFFSLAPFSFLHTGGRNYFLFTEEPGAASSYGVIGIILWIVYVLVRRRTRTI